MSALLEKPTGYGTPATFWRLYKIVINRRSPGITVHIGGYISEAAFDAGAEPVSMYQRELGQEEIPFDLNNLTPGTPAYQLFGLMYSTIMADQFFSGAQPI